MYIYWKCGQIGAVYLEWNKEFGISPFFTTYSCKNEKIIDMPMLRIIVSGPDALRKEITRVSLYGSNKKLSKTFAGITKN